jgi:cysteine desulfurase
MLPPVIYADHNATTPCLPEAAAAVAQALLVDFGNPSARHHVAGRAALSLVDGARASVAALLRVRSEELLFTSGATESCNLAITGMAGRLLPQRPVFVALAVEHPAVLAPLERLAAYGAEIRLIPVRTDGSVDLAAAAAAIDKRTALVAAMLVNNETGVIHDVPALAALAHAVGALVLCDITQAPARMAVDLPALGCDLAALSAHKLYGPKGVGALWLRRGLALDPLQVGGGQERGLRAGTLNVPGIAGFGVAAQVAHARLNDRMQHLRALSAALETMLASALPGLVIHGAQRVPGVAMLTLPGLRHGWLTQLVNVAASAGSACASGTGEASHVLTALGVNHEDARNSIRISLGESTTDSEVSAIADALIRGVRRLR